MSIVTYVLYIVYAYMLCCAQSVGSDGFWSRGLALAASSAGPPGSAPIKAWSNIYSVPTWMVSHEDLEEAMPEVKDEIVQEDCDGGHLPVPWLCVPKMNQS